MCVFVSLALFDIYSKNVKRAFTMKKIHKNSFFLLQYLIINYFYIGANACISNKCFFSWIVIINFGEQIARDTNNKKNSSQIGFITISTIEKKTSTMLT